MDGIRSIAATIRTTQLLSRPRKSLPQGKDPAGSGDPNTVGADRIINTLAASRIYRSDTIVVDLGTATTYDCITAEGVFLGGIIAPGLRNELGQAFVTENRNKHDKAGRVHRVNGAGQQEQLERH